MTKTKQVLDNPALDEQKKELDREKHKYDALPHEVEGRK